MASNTPLSSRRSSNVAIALPHARARTTRSGVATNEDIEPQATNPLDNVTTTGHEDPVGDVEVNGAHAAHGDEEDSIEQGGEDGDNEWEMPSGPAGDAHARAPSSAGDPTRDVLMDLARMMSQQIASLQNEVATMRADTRVTTVSA